MYIPLIDGVSVTKIYSNIIPPIIHTTHLLRSMANEKLYIFLHFIFYKHLRDIENEGFLEVHVEVFHALKLNTLLQNIDF